MQIPSGGLNGLAPPQMNYDSVREMNSGEDSSSKGIDREAGKNRQKTLDKNDDFKSVILNQKSKRSTAKNLQDENENSKRADYQQDNTDEKPTVRKSSKQKDTRNSAVQKLMDSLESEFGISAERFSAALAQLPPEVKVMSVEDAAPYVVDQLGFEGSDKSNVIDAYVNLIKKSGVSDSSSSVKINNKNLQESKNKESDFSNLLNPWESSNSSSLDLDGDSSTENIKNASRNPNDVSKLTKRQKLNATIDEMNRKFFSAQQQKSHSETSEAQALSEKMNDVDDQIDHQKTLSPNTMSPGDKLFGKLDRNASISNELKKDQKSDDLLIGTQGNLETSPEELALGNFKDDLLSPEPNRESFIEDRSLANDQLSNGAVTSSQPLSQNAIKKMKINSAEASAQNISDATNTPFNGTTGFTSIKDLEQVLSSGDLEALKGFTEKAGGGPNKMWSVEELPYLTQQMEAKTVAESQLSEETSDFMGSNKNSLSHDGLAKLSEKDSAKRKASLDDLINEFNLNVDQAGNVKNNLSENVKGINNKEIVLTPQDRKNNIERLSTAAENLAVRGGGEVRVVLAPEGLGSIQLKVSVHEGRVQVEMKTDSKESQKVLESSLGDLRHSLASQSLSVDSVKVDLGNDFSHKESNQQAFNQPQLQPDLGRDQARQFMNQFREENLFQRQSLFEPPGFKSYRNQREDSVEAASPTPSVRRTVGINKGRDLNLVA